MSAGTTDPPPATAASQPPSQSVPRRRAQRAGSDGVAGFVIQPFAWLGSFVGLIAFTGFEIGVSFIQGFVFAILAAVYIGSSLHPAH